MKASTKANLKERTIVPLQQAAVGVAETNERVEIGKDIFAAQNVAKDIACVHQEGFEVDDDKEPESVTRQ